jgi:hypothetical protein
MVNSIPDLPGQTIYEYTDHMESQPSIPPPALTEEQTVIAHFFVTECGLGEVADRQLTMMGATGTVRYGLGRCAEHLENMTPDEVKAMVLAILKEQEQLGQPQPE